MTEAPNPYAPLVVDEPTELEPLTRSISRAIGVGIAVWFIAFIAIGVLASFPVHAFPDSDLLKEVIDGTLLYAPVSLGGAVAGVRLLKARQPAK